MPNSTFRKTTAMLASVQFLNMLDYMVIIPLAPQLMDALALSPMEFSIVLFSYSAGATMGGGIGAFFIDRYDRRRALLTLLFLFALATLGCALAPSLVLLASARAIAGMCGGSLEALGLTIVGERCPQTIRARVIGEIMAMYPLATIAGLPASLLLSNWFDWHAPFMAIALLAAALWWLVLFHFSGDRSERPAVPEETIVDGLRQVLSSHQHRWALLVTATVIVASSSLVPYLATHMVRNLSVTAEQLPLFYLTAGAVTALTTPMFGWLADRYGRRLIFRLSATIAILPVLAMTQLPLSQFTLVVACGTLLTVFLSAQYSSAVALITAVVDARYRGRFMSLNTACEHLSIGVTALLVGIILSKGVGGVIHGYENIGLLSVLAILTAVTLVTRLPMFAQQ